MNKTYGKFAYIYDRFAREKMYEKQLEYLESIFRKFNFVPKKILDLACGTGTFLIHLNKRGYDVVGIDASEDMLKVAKNKIKKINLEIPLFHKDMRNFSLKWKIDCVTCLYDSLNNLNTVSDLKKTFKCVNNSLNKKGLFIFDVNTEYFIKNFFCQTEARDLGDIAYLREGKYDNKSKKVELKYVFFVKIDDKCYKKFHEIHHEKAFTLGEINRTLGTAQFDILGTYDPFSFNEISATTKRAYFVARKK